MRSQRTENSVIECAFREHFVRVVAVITRLVGDRSRAEDLVAEAFGRLLARPVVLRPRGNVAGWLYRTAINIGLDALRADMRRKSKHEAISHIARGQADPDDALAHMLRQERREHVRSVLSRLKPIQSQLLLLRSCGLTYKELSEALKLNPGSVGTLLARAEAEFHKRYQALPRELK